jgi:hypothetical protein
MDIKHFEAVAYPLFTDGKSREESEELGVPFFLHGSFLIAKKAMERMNHL